jgi:hypothetical protein
MPTLLSRPTCLGDGYHYTNYSPVVLRHLGRPCTYTGLSLRRKIKYLLSRRLLL